MQEVKLLDGVTHKEEEIFLKLIQTIKISGVASVTIHLFPLLKLVAQSFLQHKTGFFKQLTQLPEDITDKCLNWKQIISIYSNQPYVMRLNSLNKI